MGRQLVWSRLGVVLLCACLGMAARAVDAPVPQTAPAEHTDDTEQLDEVVIEGQKLYQLRQEIVKAEDRFFEAFNELNKDDDYDIHCENSTTAGTRLKTRQCKPVFIADAQAAEARSLLTGEYAPPAQLIALEREDDYRKKVLEVINKNPKLRKMVREHDALEQGYIKARKERFKGRWILFE